MFIAAKLTSMTGISELLQAPNKFKCISRLLDYVLQFCPSIVANNDEEALLEQTIAQLASEPQFNDLLCPSQLRVFECCQQMTLPLKIFLFTLSPEQR